jgi:hypothetical protein
MQPRAATSLLLLMLLANVLRAESPIDIGTRRELFVDTGIVGGLSGDARRELHRPIAREVAIVTDQPWEGNGVNYVTAFRDGDVYRLYYRGVDVQYGPQGYHEPHREVYCYAESKDGIQWTKPTLSLFEFNGSKENNIVWDGLGTHNFTPFKDTNPAAPADARYKGLGYGQNPVGRGMFAFKSADAIHWSLVAEQPVITKGAFDSQNVAFYDNLRKEYREYHRDFRDGRDIRTCTSQDFVHWTEPTFLEYVPSRVSELYTNGVLPYYRAPHIFLGFPTRYVDRGWTEAVKFLPRWDYRQIRGAKSPREGTAITDGMLMSSRDGAHFEVWPESYLRPGLRMTDSWFYGDTYQNWGLVETKSAVADAPAEISFYVTENTMQDRPAYLRRYSTRIDGFVSVTAPLSGGELLTKPIRFQGTRLSLNYSTSAVGSLRIEIQDEAGKPLPGFSLSDAPDHYGDSLEQVALWKPGVNLKTLAGQTIRLRFVLRDADLYSFQFTE